MFAACEDEYDGKKTLSDSSKVSEKGIDNSFITPVESMVPSYP